MRRALSLFALLAACGSTPLAPHHADLSKQLPPTLEAHRPKLGEPRPLHVRAYADAGVRTNASWRDDIAEQIDYASQLLTPLCGIKLVVDDLKEWDRSGEPRDARAALRALDPGDDVTWVIGYVVPNDVASTAMSELGDAQLFDKHVIVHAWATAAEAAALAPKLPAELTEAERAEVLAAHRRHKQTVVLLHQLGVSLGAIAVGEPGWIEHAAYAPAQMGFADRNRELMQLALDELVGSGTPKTIAPKLLESIEARDWGGWIPADRDDVLAALRNVVDQSKAGQTAADVPASAYAAFDRVRELMKAQNFTEARIQLDGLLAAYPGNATIHELRCELLLVKPGVRDAVTRQQCARVSELAPGDPTPHLAVGAALAELGDLAAAHGELAQAQATIGNLPTGAPAAWQQLIAIYAKLGALTWIDDALAAAQLPDDPAAAIVRQTRARYGVPRGATFVTAADEPALVAAVKAALAQIYAGKLADAERTLAAADKRWPRAPGVLAARCDLAMRRNDFAGATAACERAIAADPDESWAQYLDGLLRLRAADASPAANAAGIAHLRAAIAADPQLQPAWRALAKALDRIGDRAALDRLRADYAKLFGAPLPP